MTEDLLRRGRWRTWTPYLLALAILVATFAYGAAVYDSLPDRVPLHWGARGEPTRWGEKSVGTVFVGLMMTAMTLPTVAVVGAVVPMMSAHDGERSAWTRLRVEGSLRGIRSGLGWMCVVIVGSVAALSVQAWRSETMTTSTWPLVVLLVGCLGALVPPYVYWARWARRTAEVHGIHPTPEEESEDRLWLPLGLYNDPEDPRVLVPRREGFGPGTTFNVGNPRGRAWAIAVLAGPILIAVALLVVAMTRG